MRDIDGNYSLIRVLNASPDSDAFDVYINDTLFFNALEFTQFSPYVYVPEGDYRMSIYPMDTTENPILTKSIEVDDEELITIAITGNSNNLNLLNIEEDTEGTNGRTSKMRMVNLVPGSPRVNILANNNVLFPDVEFRDITDYEQVSPGMYAIDAELIENGQIVLSTPIDVTADRIYTLYALGNVPNVEIYQSLDGATFIRNKRHRK